MKLAQQIVNGLLDTEPERYTNAQLFEMHDRYDCFNIARITLTGQLQRIFEAWLPDRKNEIVQKMRQRGFELTGHAQLGDYDLALWTTRRLDPDFFGVEAANFVSLNVGQHDPTEQETQMTDTESGKIPIKAVARKLSEWAQAHGKLAVSSYLPGRTARYYRIIPRLIPNCSVSWIRPGQPEFGFYVEP